MGLRVRCGGAMMAMAACLASAHAQPAAVAAQAYVSALGFFPGDAKRAAIGVPGQDSALSPAELGVLILEQREVTSVWRARWVIRLTRRQIGADTLDFTEIERFNMGPATRAQLVQAGATAAPSEAFGVGPHVAWRIVTRPDGPSRTLLLNVGRRDYPEFEAKDRDCGGTLCTSVRSPLGTRTQWQMTQDATAPAAATPFPAIVTRTDGRVEFEDESIAHGVRGLSVLAGLASGSGPGFNGSVSKGSVWIGPAPGAPVTILVDSNVAEDGGCDAAVGPIGDASWIRRTATVAVPPDLSVRVFEGTIRRR